MGRPEYHLWVRMKLQNDHYQQTITASHAHSNYTSPITASHAHTNYTGTSVIPKKD